MRRSTRKVFDAEYEHVHSERKQSDLRHAELLQHPPPLRHRPRARLEMNEQ